MPEKFEIKSKVESLAEVLEKTAESRAEYTRGFLSKKGKSLEELCSELSKNPFNISIKPEDNKNLVSGIAKLQKFLGFPEADDAQGCDGKYGPYTHKKYQEYLLHGEARAEIQDIKAEITPSVSPAKVDRHAAKPSSSRSESSQPKAEEAAPSTSSESTRPVENQERVSTSETVFVGDSITVGMRPHIGEAKNVNKGGMQTGWMAENFSKFLKKKPAEIKRVVILGGINDICSNRSVKSVIDNLSKMVEQARQAGLSVVLCTIPDWDTEKYVRYIRKDWEDRGWGNYPLTADELKNRTNQVNTWVLAQNNCAKVDLYQEMQDRSVYGRSDFIHPSGKGYKAMAKYIMQTAGISKSSDRAAA